MFLIWTPHKTRTFTVGLAVTTIYQGNGFAAVVLHGRDHPRFVPIGPIVTEVIAFPILGTWWDATLKSIDYNVAITFILNNNNNNATTEVASQSVRLERGGRIPSCSQYWKCYNFSYDGTDWYESWVVASIQHLCCEHPSCATVGPLVSELWHFEYFPTWRPSAISSFKNFNI